MITNYYRKHKENLQNEASQRYQNLYEEEKEKRQKKAQDRYQKLSGQDKEKNISFIVSTIRIFLKKKKKRKLSI